MSKMSKSEFMKKYVNDYYDKKMKCKEIDITSYECERGYKRKVKVLCDTKRKPW